MRVLYVSKAMLASAYRDKVAALGRSTELTLLTPQRWGERRMEDGGVAVPCLRTLPALLHGHNHLHLYRGAGRLLDALRPNLVHIDEEPYSAVTFQLAWLAQQRRIPSIFFAWQNLSKRLPPPFGALRARVFRMVAGGIAGTERAAGVLRGAGFRGPLATIPQVGVDPVRFAADPAARARTRARVGVRDGEVLIGYGGRLVREKGVGTLLRAGAALPGSRLLVMGDGPERTRLEALARDLGLGDRVHFTGDLPTCAVAEWLPGVDVLVLPSLGRAGWVEQFGRILVEAMACGIAVVGSEVGEIPHVVGDAGLTVPAGDVEALSAALRRLAADPRLRTELGRCGRRRVLQHYTQDRIARKTVEFYHRLLGPGREGVA